MNAVDLSPRPGEDAVASAAPAGAPTLWQHAELTHGREPQWDVALSVLEHMGERDSTRLMFAFSANESPRLLLERARGLLRRDLATLRQAFADGALRATPRRGGAGIVYSAARGLGDDAAYEAMLRLQLAGLLSATYLRPLHADGDVPFELLAPDELPDYLAAERN